VHLTRKRLEATFSLWLQIILGALVVALLTTTCRASSATGSILGNVSDETGASLGGATVELRNVDTGVVRSTVVDHTGNYSFVLLPPGNYDLTVHLTSFRDAALNGIQLDVDQVRRADLTLRAAPVTLKVSVSGALPLVETETSAVGKVVPENLVSNLPLNERNYLTLTLLVPGAHTPVAGSQASTMGPGSFSVNGAREQANGYLLDGIDNNGLYINRTSVLPSIDAIDEFKVQASTYSAEYGRYGGTQVNLVLKSGTNAFHGNAFEYFRNRELDAKNYFDLPYCTAASPAGSCGPIPGYQRSQFGGTIGGPIQSKRTFFFASYEGLDLRQAITQEATVPSQETLGALFAAIPPAYRNAAGVATLNLYPAANVGADLANSTLYVSSPAVQGTGNIGTVKLDSQLTAQDLLSGHYAIYDSNSYLPFDFGFTVSALPGYGDYHNNRGQNVGIDWTHSFTPHAVNDFRVGYDRDRLQILQQNHGTNRSAELGYPAPPNPQDWGYPDMLINGYETIGEPFNAPQDIVDNEYQLTDNVTWLPQFGGGRHRFKFGGDFHRIQQNGYVDFYSRGLWNFIGITGSSLEDVLIGLPAVSLFASGDTETHFRSFSESYYAIDDYHVAPNLTLNLGLRYEYNSAPIEINNHISIANTGPESVTCTPKPDCQYTVAGTPGYPRALYSTGKLNFAPRVGLAWSVLPSGKLVVRSGYGIFFDIGILNINVLLGENPPFYNFLFSENDGTSNIQTIIDSPLSSTISFRTAPNYKNTYLQQWSLGVESQITSSLMAEVGYVGSEGTHLTGFADDNQAVPVGSMPYPPPYPQFGSIATIDTSRCSTYHSLQATLQQRMAHGTSFLAAYTWSKSIDNGSEFTVSNTEGQYAQNSNNLAGERGLSAFDARERLVLSYVAKLPFGPGAAYLNRTDFLGQLVGGWQISGIVSLQTGQPFTVNRSTYQSYTTYIVGSDRPDQISNPFQPGPVPSNPNPACGATISHGGAAADKVRTVETWVNPCAYSNPNLLGEFRFGTAPRNEVTGPGLIDLDASVSRAFAIVKERLSLDARADFFNFLNHPNFDPPVRTFDSQNFGSIPSANTFGNRPPRQIQIAVNLVF
jgi:Carboxypeptidase regulatory-like domain/TonB dependent receptor